MKTSSCLVWSQMISSYDILFEVIDEFYNQVRITSYEFRLFNRFDNEFFRVHVSISCYAFGNGKHLTPFYFVIAYFDFGIRIRYYYLSVSVTVLIFYVHGYMCLLISIQMESVSVIPFEYSSSKYPM